MIKNSDYLRNFLKNDNTFSNLVYVSFLVSALSLFVLSIQGNLFLLQLKQTLFVIVPFIIGTVLMIRRSLGWSFWTLCTGTALHFLFSHRLDVLQEFVLFSWLIFLLEIKATRKTGISFAKAFGFFLCLIIAIHFYFFDSYNRESIGGLDPNYSSFLIFLILPLAIHTKSYLLHLALISLGMLTQSRGFFLGAVFFYASFFCFYIFKSLRVSFRTFILCIFLGFIFLMIYSYYGYTSGFESYGGYSEGLKRLIHIFNNSADFDRWKANIIHFQESFRNTDFLLKGMEPGRYLKTVNPFLPHNIFLLEISARGILLGMFYLVVFFKVIKSVFIPKYVPFFIGLLVYWFFLGIEIAAIYNIFLVSMLKIIIEPELGTCQSITESTKAT